MPSLINGLKNFPEGLSKFAEVIVRGILDCLDDNENKIRMTALKSLYYIAKTLDDKIIRMFNIIFDKLITKINDLDEVVRNAANFFDKSLQTILTSALNSPEGRQEFDLERFMQIVKTKLKSMNPGVREFLIKWIVNLNEIMSIDLLSYLPELLEDLLFMLGDKEKNLRNSAEECLNNFSKDMTEKFEEGKLENYLSEDIINKMVGILIKMAKGKHPGYTKLNTLGWFKTLFHFFRLQI
jgi:vacuole morphology and inheritance protein 14